MTDTATAEAVEVPRPVLDTVIATFATAAQQGRDFHPQLADALRSVIDRDLPAGTRPGTARLDAEAAWHLADVGDAIDAFHLDEEDPAIWTHPAVAAQTALADLVDEQAPDTAARLTAELEAA